MMIEEQASFVFRGAALKMLDSVKEKNDIPTRERTLIKGLKALEKLSRIERAMGTVQKKGDQVCILRKGKYYDITSEIRKTLSM
jgi:hypothetical protein